MRTFNKVKQFGSGITGATGGKSNEALLFQNTTATTVNITVQARNPDGSIVKIGPLNMTTNQLFIFPISAYGWTGSVAGINCYELF